MIHPMKVAVIAGGISSEREISLKSGTAVFEALKRSGYDAVFVDIKRSFYRTLLALDADVLFLALHGRFGEDGRIQSLCEDIGFAYTGSGVEASRLAMDKIRAKEAISSKGIAVPHYIVVEKGRDAYGRVKDFGIPCVVKPQREGSSIGLTIVKRASQLKHALRNAFRYDEGILIEEYIEGREITVGILDNRTLPVIEIVTRHSVYDYHAKYNAKDTRYIVPAKISPASYKDAQRYALKSHEALGCRDLSRVDMRIDKRGRIYVLEVNTIPGMTQRSLLPKAAACSGIKFDDLCVKIVKLAYNRRKGATNAKRKNKQEIGKT